MITADTKKERWKHRHPTFHKVMDYIYEVFVWLVILFVLISGAITISWLMQEDIEHKNSYFDTDNYEVVAE